MTQKILIVGGGTAGWMTAGILAAEFKNYSKPIEIVLVESPDIATIGVGEGTWPSMRTTLEHIGISESDFMRKCDASFKQGSKFVGWRTGEANDFYYHPFSFPSAYLDANFHSVWQNEFSHLSYWDAASTQGAVCERALAPKQPGTPEYAGVMNYGYHLNAGKFAELLKEHCVSQLNVKHIVDNVVDVSLDNEGYIKHISTEKSGDIPSDLFIDCSGTHCLLLGKTLGIQFVSQSKYSANDTALAVQVPYPDENTEIASATIGTAHSAGWTWDIGLSSRRGVGYVYSSSHIEDQNAEDELLNYLSKNTEQKIVEQLEFRKIKINVGHREKLWHKNCVAIGMAAGFIEPLEASALAMVELSANFVRDELPYNRTDMLVLEKKFNEVFSYRWQRIIEFLKLHYVLTSRKDTDYWKDCSADNNTPESLKNLLETWKHRPPYHRDLLQTEEVFPSASYQYVLYGMGFKTSAPGGRKTDNTSEGKAQIEREFSMREKIFHNLPSNRNLLNGLKEKPFRKT